MKEIIKLSNKVDHLRNEINKMEGTISAKMEELNNLGFHDEEGARKFTKKTFKQVQDLQDKRNEYVEKLRKIMGEKEDD